MKWWVLLVGALFAISIVLLAVGGAETPRRIQTLEGSSPEEDAYKRRAARLRMFGFASLAFALAGLIVFLKLMM